MHAKIMMLSNFILHAHQDSYAVKIFLFCQYDLTQSFSRALHFFALDHPS